MKITVEIFLGDDDHDKLAALGMEPEGAPDCPNWMGDYIEHDFTASWEVCGECDGQGTTMFGWRNADQPAYTAEDFEEDPDFYSNMMAGAYDKPCPVCKGRTTIKVVDENDIKNPLDVYLWQLYRKQVAE